MKRVVLIVAMLASCAEGSGARDMPDTGMGDTTTERPPLDPNIPAICQDDAWPDCPPDVAAFVAPGEEARRVTDPLTCGTPKTCAVCQYVDPGAKTCRGTASPSGPVFDGYCKAVTRVGTCDAPGEPVAVRYTVYCIGAKDNYVDVCPAGN